MNNKIFHQIEASKRKRNKERNVYQESDRMVRARGNLQAIKETLKHLCIHVYMRV